MKNALFIPLLFASLAGAQTAVWPGSAATDSQLLVGANLCQTRLAQSIPNTTNTTIFVTNSAPSAPYCFVPNQEIQIDNEFFESYSRWIRSVNGDSGIRLFDCLDPQQ